MATQAEIQFIDDGRRLVTGVLARKIHYGDGGFLIAVVKPFDYSRTSDSRELVIRGTVESPAWGELYEFGGDFETHPKFGEQFVLSWYRLRVPTDTDAIERYIQKTLPHIGKVTAGKLVARYGLQTVDVLRELPELVAAECENLNEDEARDIAGELQAISGDMLKARIWLEQILGNTRIRKSAVDSILRQHGANAPEKIRENPYRLAEFAGVGFQTADRIAIGEYCKYAPEGMERRAAAVRHVLEDAAGGDGHTVMAPDDVKAQTKQLIGFDADPVLEQPPAEIKVDERGVSLQRLYSAESSIAERIRMLTTTAASVEVDPAILRNLDSDDEDNIFRDAKPDQIEAARIVLTSKVVIVIGRPGTGKTWLIEKCLNAICGDPGLFSQPHPPACAAPTGKAAKQMIASTKRQARTIHSLLGLTPETEKSLRYGIDNRMPARVVCLDETSMIDSRLFSHALDAMRDDARLIIVGDSDQLPSVGAGAVLRDLIASGTIPVAKLTQIKRNSGDLLRAVHSVGDGVMPSWSPKLDLDAGQNVRFIEADNENQIGAMILEVTKRMAARDFDPIWDVQVLSPLNSDGPLCVEQLNEFLGAKLMPTPPIEPWGLRVGEKVIRTKNGTAKLAGEDGQAWVVNGDMGKVVSISDDEMVVEHWYPDRTVRYGKATHFCVPAWALTVHKAQGSGFPIVILPIHSSFAGRIWTRTWLYTALSRAEKACVLIGSKEIFARALPIVKQRNTRLEYMLREIMGNGRS